ncbi:hypothetical protein [Chryseobacterium sp. RU33C]|uniref:hypothetical protein n=1 Tax=Chryseobacterium sp. RU33C TaxID=1907398 RepID=UPI000956B541|nr:hypothetical protein [Chryseobacterium sp. RU33C]SIR58405.1 hypothetical protein SAMN05880573_12828 [Chryseobacterium sp. RU33C]
MRKNLLLAGLFTTFSLVVKSQVGINTTNPQGVFNIDGLKNNPTTGVPTATQAKDDLVMISNGNLGLGLTAPGTTLDVNGAITNRETALAVAGNAVTIPVNVSQVQLTGAATATVAISAFAAPNPGQRLIVYNNTTGGFGATLDGVTIPNGKALEFVFSNSFWRSTDGGAAGANSVNIYTANGTLAGNRTVTTAGNSLSFTNGSNSVSVGTTGTEGIVRANGASRGSFLATGGGNTLSMYADDNGKAVMMTSGNNTGIDIGAATADPVNILTNNTNRVTVTSAGSVGVATTTPQRAMHVNGALQVTNEINVGGNGTTAGNAGTSGQILTSGGAGAAPTWQTLNTVSGTINSAVYVQGTTEATATVGQTIDVPGVTATLTVPAGRTQTFLFTILGYATNFPSGGTTSQGVFILEQNNVKISSAYTNKVGAAGGGLNDLPVPVTFLKSVTLSAGTYTFKVRYSAWAGTAKVNVNPTPYTGYDGDTEAMLTKMQILVYNN